LRTRGEVPTGLESALLDVAAEAIQSDVHVELVSVELRAETTPAAAAAVRDTVRDAIGAAREFDGVERAVVRAASGDGDVTISVRAQGGGFVVGDASAYERHVTRSIQRVHDAGGRLDVWSEPGRGIRVTVVVPGVEGRTDEAADGFPQRGVGRRG